MRARVCVCGLSSRYLTTFNYIHLRAQRNADLMINVEKEFIWPHSFQECTHALRTYSICLLNTHHTSMYVI